MKKLFKNTLILNFIVVCLFFYTNNAYGEKSHGIAMHGVPKYKNNFTHLDYVNPNAPKGGILKFGVYGSYDNLNRVAFKGSKAAGLVYINDSIANPYPS